MADNPQLVTVRFTAPVEGIDPFDGDLFISTKHRVAAVYVCRDGGETLFINDDGEVVARWNTRLIDGVEWSNETRDDPHVKPSAARSSGERRSRSAIPARTSAGPRRKTPSSPSRCETVSPWRRWPSFTTVAREG
jgi:hypothetical protein